MLWARSEGVNHKAFAGVRIMHYFAGGGSDAPANAEYKMDCPWTRRVLK